VAGDAGPAGVGQGQRGQDAQGGGLVGGGGLLADMSTGLIKRESLRAVLAEARAPEQGDGGRDGGGIPPGTWSVPSGAGFPR
jgi:hypothetical protein